MSGGPIFAWEQDASGGVRYWLHAVQSGWHRPTRAIAACPTRALGALLAGLIERGVPEDGCV